MSIFAADHGDGTVCVGVVTMRQLKLEEVAFCQPGGEGTRAEQKKPLDLAHLGAQTLDDRDLQNEVLKLFIHSTEMFAAQLAEADDAARKALAHKLGGSARAIGAFALSELAGVLERAPGDASALNAVQNEIVRVKDFIASIQR